MKAFYTVGLRHYSITKKTQRISRPPMSKPLVTLGRKNSFLKGNNSLAQPGSWRGSHLLRMAGGERSTKVWVEDKEKGAEGESKKPHHGREPQFNNYC